jgi:hypothetical protein
MTEEEKEIGEPTDSFGESPDRETSEAEKKQKELHDYNFSLIAHEIERQYDTTSDSNHIITEKVGILLGFIILIFVQIGLTDVFTSVQLSIVGLHILYFGIISLSIAFIIGVYLFVVRKYPLGPDSSELIKCYRNGEDINFQQKITRGISDSLEELNKFNTKSAYWFKIMFWLAITGVVLAILSRLFIG